MDPTTSQPPSHILHSLCPCPPLPKNSTFVPTRVTSTKTTTIHPTKEVFLGRRGQGLKSWPFDPWWFSIHCWILKNWPPCSIYPTIVCPTIVWSSYFACLTLVASPPCALLATNPKASTFLSRTALSLPSVPT